MGQKCFKCCGNIQDIVPNIVGKNPKEERMYVELRFYALLINLLAENDSKIKLRIPETLTFGYNMIPSILQNDLETGKLYFQSNIKSEQIKQMLNQFKDINFQFPSAICKTSQEKSLRDYCWSFFDSQNAMKAWNYAFVQEIPCIFQRFVFAKNQELQIIQATWENDVIRKTVLTRKIQTGTTKQKVIDDDSSFQLWVKLQQSIKNKETDQINEILKESEVRNRYQIHQKNTEIWSADVQHSYQEIDEEMNNLKYILQRHFWDKLIISIQADWIYENQGKVYFINLKNYTLSANQSEQVQLRKPLLKINSKERQQLTLYKNPSNQQMRLYQNLSPLVEVKKNMHFYQKKQMNEAFIENSNVQANNLLRKQQQKDKTLFVKNWKNNRIKLQQNNSSKNRGKQNTPPQFGAKAITFDLINNQEQNKIQITRKEKRSSTQIEPSQVQLLSNLNKRLQKKKTKTFKPEIIQKHSPKKKEFKKLKLQKIVSQPEIHISQELKPPKLKSSFASHVELPDIQQGKKSDLLVILKKKQEKKSMNLNSSVL